MFDKLTPDQYLSFFKTHTLGHYLMNLAVIPSMQKNHFGRVVNVTSVLGINGIYSTQAYTASRGRGDLPAQGLRQEIRQGQYHLQRPRARHGRHADEDRLHTRRDYAAVAAMTPLGRVAQAIDIARVALFFAQGEPFRFGPNPGRRRGCDGINL